MVYELLILGLVPLFIFAFLDYKVSQKAALKGAMITSCVVLVGIYWLTKQIDWIEVASACLLIGLAVISMRLKKDIYFKLQPGIIGLIFGSLMLAVYIVRKQSYFDYFEKYRPIFHEAAADMFATQGFAAQTVDEQASVISNMIENGIALIPLVAVALLIHALIMIHAARHWTTMQWIVARGMQLPMVVITVFLVAKIRALG